MSCSVELSIIFFITSGPELFCEVSTPKFSSGTLTYINGWMPCDFTSFLLLFQSYQDNGRVIMKGCIIRR